MQRQWPEASTTRLWVNCSPPAPSCRSNVQETIFQGSQRRVALNEDDQTFLKDWRAYGRSLEFPSLVKNIMQQVTSLELELGEKNAFGGPKGSLQGRARDVEDRRHRAAYRNLLDSKQKLQFFSARQVACRILGSKGYLCEECWLPLLDCICKQVDPAALWPGVQLWLYMHPKDFLRKNNSGKLLWLVFGKESIHLCIYGIKEQEDVMWESFEKAGEGLVWMLYPEANVGNFSIDEITIPYGAVHDMQSMDCKSMLNFILIDGTWSNSKAMVNRLKDHAKVTWGRQHIQSVSLSLNSPSVLHGLSHPWIERAQLQQPLNC